MSRPPPIVRNAVWNSCGMAASMLAGLVVVPFLVHRLGQTVYGLWILIASFTNYFSLLDMGVRRAVARELTFFRAKGDLQGVNRVFSTATALLSGAGLVALLGTLGVMALFFWLFDVPVGQVEAVRLSLLLVGLNLVLWLPLNVFDAVLWSRQRFDLINGVDMLAVGARVGLTFWVVGRGWGLVGLAMVNLVFLGGAQAVKAIIVFWLEPGLRLSVSRVTADAARRLVGIGFWNALLSLSRMVSEQAGSAIIGALAAVSLVPPFSIAARLVAYAQNSIMAATDVVIPLAITLHAEDRPGQQRELFLKGSRACLALTLLAGSVLVILGRDIFGLWLGAPLEWAAGLLYILVLGEVLPMSQWVGHSVLLGKYRHRGLAILNAIENAMAVTLAMLLIGPGGLAGVCIGFAVSATLWRGVVQCVYTCRITHTPLRRFVGEVIIPVSAAAALPAGALALVARAWPAGSWVHLLGMMFVYTLVFGAVMWVLLRRPKAKAEDEEWRMANRAEHISVP